MLIDHVFPQAAKNKARLPDRLIAEAEARNLAPATINAVLSVLPSDLASAGAFFDEMTGLWRYEFGVPYQLGTSLIWGTHMWLPIRELLSCLLNVQRFVPLEKRASYLRVLADPEKHPQTLVEMAPVTRLGSEVALDFEVSGQGNGNRTVDWLLRPTGARTVLCDVKRRTKDFLIQFERIGDSPEAPEPDHDPALLFKSLEQKFVANEPNITLQGAWIFTDITQNEARLQAAFESLDASKVHFAVLGDWGNEAHVISRRWEDAQFLHELFCIVDSTRFVFSASASPNP
jgi:hypothetical protein